MTVPMKNRLPSEEMEIVHQLPITVKARVFQYEVSLYISPVVFMIIR